MYNNQMQPTPNPGKNLLISCEKGNYVRVPVKTHVITDKDNITDVCKKYAATLMVDEDMLFISERIVAISQGRAFPISEIKPSHTANFLVKFVHKSPYGIGLKSPWTMELALREAGVARILFGAILSAITKPFGIKGVFYRVVGKNINAIDGPCSYTLPPYNNYAKLGPSHPKRAAEEIARAVGHPVVIIDANDLGVNILGASDPKISNSFCQEVFRDNPLGQTNEQTPLCIVRRSNLSQFKKQ